MTDFFDRQGKPLELLEWAALYEDTEYRIVRRTVSGTLTLSTVWQGFQTLPSIINPNESYNEFETACWEEGESVQRSNFRILARHTTEEDAIDYHEQFLAEWESGK